MADVALAIDPDCRLVDTARKSHEATKFRNG